jgi:hypothetical protein
MLTRALIVTILSSIVIFWLMFTMSGGLLFGSAATLFSLVFLVDGLEFLLTPKHRRKTPFSLWNPDWKMLRKICLQLIVFLGVIFVVKAIWLGYYPVSGSKLIANQEREDLLYRRAYLINKLASPSFDLNSMPSFLSKDFQQEWAIGSFSMATTALVQIAFAFPETRNESAEVVRTMIHHMLERQIRDYEVHWWNEDALDTLETSNNGHAGYLGHLNLMIGGYRFLGGGGEFDDLHIRVSEALAGRVSRSPHFFIETFPNSIFIPDNAAVVASLALFNRLHNQKHQQVVSDWMAYCKNNLLEPESGLLRPWITKAGQPHGPARGSYVAWNIYYLSMIDLPFAKEQYQRLKKSFQVDLPFGAKAIREYKHGTTGPGDIDSGPIVFGLSTSGTGFAVAGARLFEDSEMLGGLLYTAEAVGSSWDANGTRRYLLAPIVGDAIMLAMKTAIPWDLRYLAKEN